MSSQPAYSSWQNNAHPSWWKDAGLRSMMTSLSVVYAASFTFGYDGTLLASLIILPQWSAYFGNPTGNTMGLIAASFYFPKIVAPAVASYCSDRFGRRPSLFTGACFAIAGSLVTCFSNSRNMFIGGRVILGWGAGMQEAIAPYVLQELAHPRMRSAIGSSLLSSYFIGTICAGFFGLAVLNWDSDWSWRLLNLLQAAGSVWMVTLILLRKMVESPRWLVKVGRVQEAHEVLAKMHANGQMDDALVVNELNEMKEVQSAADQSSQAGLKDFWATVGAKKRLFVVIVAAAGTQLSGSVLISAYLGPILDNVGITDSAAQVSLLAGLNIYGFAVLMFVATSVVERYGRRPVWLWSIGLQTLCFTIFTALSGGYEATQNPAIGVATIPFIYLYFGFYVACWSTVAPMYASEILPTMLRSKGIAIYSTVQSVTVTYNQYVNPIAIEAIAWRYYFLFVAMQIFFFVYAWFGFKETKGYTMEEVGYVFDGPEVIEEVRRNATLQTEVDHSGKSGLKVGHDEGGAGPDLDLSPRSSIDRATLTNL